jgi:hypothetical protein
MKICVFLFSQKYLFFAFSENIRPKMYENIKNFCKDLRGKFAKNFIVTQNITLTGYQELYFYT